MAAKQESPVIQELRHEPVPGYAMPFLIAAVAATVYLALILSSSPGKVKDYEHSEEIEDPDHLPEPQPHALSKDISQ